MLRWPASAVTMVLFVQYVIIVNQEGHVFSKFMFSKYKRKELEKLKQLSRAPSK